MNTPDANRPTYGAPRRAFASVTATAIAFTVVSGAAFGTTRAIRDDRAHATLRSDHAPAELVLPSTPQEQPPGYPRKR